MIPLYLLRHGPTDISLAGAPAGQLDVCANIEAEQSWPIVKKKLTRFGIQKILTSNLQRACLHAKDLSFELNVPCQILPDLAEQDFGEWEGTPWNQVKDAGAFLKNPVYGTPPGGENFASCASRSITAMQASLEGGQTTLVIAHGGSLRAILAHFLGLSLERALDISWQPFGMTMLEVYAANRAILHYHNRILNSDFAFS